MFVVNTFKVDFYVKNLSQLLTFLRKVKINFNYLTFLNMFC